MKTAKKGDFALIEIKHTFYGPSGPEHVLYLHPCVVESTTRGRPGYDYYAMLTDERSSQFIKGCSRRDIASRNMQRPHIYSHADVERAFIASSKDIDLPELFNAIQRDSWQSDISLDDARHFVRKFRRAVTA